MSNNEEQQFSIQPHPATSNNPSQRFKGDDAEQTAGLGGAPNLSHLHDAQKDPTGGELPSFPLHYYIAASVLVEGATHCQTLTTSFNPALLQARDLTSLARRSPNLSRSPSLARSCR